MVYEYHCTVQKFNSIDNLIEMHKVHDAKCNYLFGSVKPVFKGHSQKDRKFVFKTNYRLMQVKREHSAILSTFIKLPFDIKIFILTVFEWLFLHRFYCIWFVTSHSLKFVAYLHLHRNEPFTK